MLTAHFGYFRPGEVFNFLKEDLVGPATDARTSLAAPILIVAPEERLVKSKTQTFDDSVRMDHPSCLGKMLADLRSSRADGASLFLLDRADLQKQWRWASALLGLEGVVLYQLRHGGASGDYLDGRRSLQDIAMRGRWRTMASVRRYTKAGRVQKVMSGLAPAVLPFVKWAHKRLEHIMAGDLTGRPRMPSAPNASRDAPAASSRARLEARRRPSWRSSGAASRRPQGSSGKGSTTSNSRGVAAVKRTR